MLILSRKLNETIVIDGDIQVTVLSIRGNQIRLGFDAPSHVPIYRQEVYVPNLAVVDDADQPIRA